MSEENPFGPVVLALTMILCGFIVLLAVMQPQGC